jgi:hypothetical protein
MSPPAGNTDKKQSGTARVLGSGGYREEIFEVIEIGH